MNRLPTLYHSVFYSERFKKVTDDAFMVSVEAKDSQFDVVKTKEFMESIGAKHVEFLEA